MFSDQVPDVHQRVVLLVAEPVDKDLLDTVVQGVFHRRPVPLAHLDHLSLLAPLATLAAGVTRPTTLAVLPAGLVTNAILFC